MAKKNNKKRVIRVRPISGFCEFCKEADSPDYRKIEKLVKYLSTNGDLNYKVTAESILANVPHEFAQSQFSKAIHVTDFDNWTYDEDANGRPIYTYAEKVIGHTKDEFRQYPNPDVLQNILDQIVKRFEVSKRIHVIYTANFHPLEKENFHDLSLYVFAAEIFEKAYSCSKKLTYLNALLKCLDTLCAVSDQLLSDKNSPQQMQQAYLI